MAGRLTRKLADALRLLRYGPTQLASLQQELAARAAQLEQADAALRQRVEMLESNGRALHGEVDRLRNDLAGFHAHLAEVTEAVTRKAADADLQFVRGSLAADLQRETGWLRDRLTALGAALDAASRAFDAQRGEGAALPPSVQAAEEAFYPALEQQFRGTRDELLARLAQYRDWIANAPPGRVADLGCGRGEWLELLAQWQRSAVGIDMNAVFVADNRARGLDAVEGDAIAWLATQPADSLAAVTSFHVVEHLPFGLLLALAEQARRALRPGGRIILETPNPENLRVGTLDFWLDPTHRRPLPPQLLEFVLAHAGFEIEATLRLNPPESAPATGDAALRELLAQGRDYAVIARKPAAAGHQRIA